ncbi:hypothetical protein DICVIV_08008 [Dictyocaulus viviparus]|uniref:Mos1 transposase HTH domain-containing protein n=1 Tax=Dictyocaulus viviparus TaxID=29172 RepID=A0A0D8XN14_DICVI|nr:hypothetical protein DICVIV_08008 [Dictyocaulus viviparus]
MENMTDKKQTRAIFLLEFKIDHKAADTACNINDACVPETWYLKKFCERDERLEIEECSGRHRKFTTTNREQSSKLNVLRLRNVTDNSTLCGRPPFK